MLVRPSGARSVPSSHGPARHTVPPSGMGTIDLDTGLDCWAPSGRVDRPATRDGTGHAPPPGANRIHWDNPGMRNGRSRKIGRPFGRSDGQMGR